MTRPTLTVVPTEPAPSEFDLRRQRATERATLETAADVAGHLATFALKLQQALKVASCADGDARAFAFDRIDSHLATVAADLALIQGGLR